MWQGIIQIELLFLNLISKLTNILKKKKKVKENIESYLKIA